MDSCVEGCGHALCRIICFVISTGLVKGKDGEPSKDTTHPIQAGAEAFAKLFLDDVKARRLPVADLFR